MNFSTLHHYLVLLISFLLVSCSNDLELRELSSSEDNSNSYVISIDEAKSDLESLLNDLDGVNSRSFGNSKHRKIKSSYSISINSQISRAEESDSAIMHVFNFEDNEGYAIMSGDSRLPSLITLTDSGSLEEEEEIEDPGVAIFLEGMENLYVERRQNLQYNYMIDDFGGGTSGDSSGQNYNVYGKWENIIYNQNGVCPVKWNQNSPYNKYCPLKNNQPTYTGCVATAVAQLMAIYKYPQSYNGYSFSWNDMTQRKYAYSCSTIGQDNIARLMQQLGLKNNLNVSYGTDASSAKTENIIRTLRSFGYSNPGTLNDYSTSKIVADLKNGYGVLICGYSHKKVTRFLGIKIKTSYSGGHQWLAHGLLERRREIKQYNSNGSLISTSYESQWYPLCNWGWGGSRDGYYLSAAFDTTKGYSYSENETSSRSSDPVEGTSDYNYQFKLTAITGIRK